MTLDSPSPSRCTSLRRSPPAAGASFGGGRWGSGVGVGRRARPLPAPAPCAPPTSLSPNPTPVPGPQASVLPVPATGSVWGGTDSTPARCGAGGLSRPTAGGGLFHAVKHPRFRGKKWSGAGRISHVANICLVLGILVTEIAPLMHGCRTTAWKCTLFMLPAHFMCTQPPVWMIEP